MPNFDGTGPKGEGPMTGRGEGYCALVLPLPKEGGTFYGYAGVQGTPVRLGGSRVLPALCRHFADRIWSMTFRRERGGRRQGRRSGCW